MDWKGNERRLERESEVKGWLLGKGKGNCKGKKEVVFSPGWHGRGGLADGRGPPRGGRNEAEEDDGAARGSI
jgi:hypothetical protein